MKLVIVESPNKVSKISQILGPQYQVMASFGHIRDLPKDGGLAIDFKEGRVEPHYTLRARPDSIRALKAAAARAEEVLLATDPDREGEAIAWHLTKVLGRHRYQRIAFQAITQSAVLAAVAAPRQIDLHLVDAQQARRVLDRVVGWVVSPTCQSGTGDAKARSAGRVQSVALRLVVERELEIRAFSARIYWSIKACLKDQASGQEFTARLVRWEKQEIKLGIVDEAFAGVITAACTKNPWVVANVETKRTKPAPPPPFTTATCQQALSVRLGLTPEDSMRALQALYEAGAITYLRTDSTAISPEGIAMARDLIGKQFGPQYLPDQANLFTSKSANAQEAHEAIRPTHPESGPMAHGDSIQGRVYHLIWARYVASQMKAGEDDVTVIDLTTVNERAGFRARGRVMVFDGWRLIGGDATDDASNAESEDSAVLPPVRQGDRPACLGVSAHKGQTKPPPRFTQASLIKKLDHDGIGRPATFAAILKGLFERGYVTETKRKMSATDTGIRLIEFLRRAYQGNFIEPGYTAKMEDLLDRIASGSARWESEITTVSHELVRMAQANGLRGDPLAA